jgi:hypothetical protein
MILLAHICMMPVEEVIVPLMSGVGAGTALWLAAILAPPPNKVRR